MIDVVVLISGSGTNLQKIIDDCHGKSINICAVISDVHTAYGLTRAAEAGIVTASLRQRENTSREDYCKQLARLVDVFTPDMVILAGFMKVLTPNFVDAFRIINIHPALLPKYPGLHTHQRAIDAGDTEHGITIHWVDHGVDTGDIIHQAECPVYPDDTAETLEARVHELEYAWYPRIITRLANIANG